MIKAADPLRPAEILRGFADMAERSRAPDGDRQGDGWGVGRLNEKNEWDVYKSVLPVWEDRGVFDEIPAGRVFLVHARSASFPQHKKTLSFNQPFTGGPFGFVFNGLLQGVSFPFPVAGQIGSQKIWTLLREALKEQGPGEGLSRVAETLDKYSRRIAALNIGLANKTGLYALCRSEDHPEYYGLRYFDTPALKMICSEPLSGFEFQTVPTGRIFVL